MGARTWPRLNRRVEPSCCRHRRPGPRSGWPRNPSRPVPASAAARRRASPPLDDDLRSVAGPCSPGQRCEIGPELSARTPPMPLCPAAGRSRRCGGPPRSRPGAARRPAAGSATTAVVPKYRGYRPDSCRNTLQGLSSSPSGAPEPASGRGRPAAAGDRRGSVRNKRSFWLNSLAARNMTGSVFPYLSEIPPKPHSMDRPVDCAAGRSQRDLDLRAHPREAPLPWVPTTAAAAREAHRLESPESLSSTSDFSPDSRGAGDQVPLAAPGLVSRAACRRRDRRPAPPSPLQCISARIWSVPFKAPLVDHVSPALHRLPRPRGSSASRASRSTVADLLEELGGSGVGQGLGQLVAPRLVLGLQLAEVACYVRLRPYVPPSWPSTSSPAPGCPGPASSSSLAPAVAASAVQIRPIARSRRGLTTS